MGVHNFQGSAHLPSIPFSPEPLFISLWPSLDTRATYTLGTIYQRTSCGVCSYSPLFWVGSNWCLGMDRCVNVLRSLPSVQAFTSWKLDVSYPFPCTLLSYLSPVKEKSQEKQSHLSPTHALPLNVLLHLHPPN